MSETSTTTGCCVDCNAEFPADYRTKRCESCREKRRYTRDNARRAERNDARWAAGEDVTCTRCGQSFPRAKRTGQVPKYCPPCRLQVKREHCRATAAKSRIVVQGQPLTTPCLDCGAVVEYLRGVGRPPERCRPCRRKRNRELSNASRRHRRRMPMVADAESRSVAHRRAAGSRRMERPEGDRPLAPRPHPCVTCGSLIRQVGSGRRRQNCDGCKVKRKTAAAAALRLTSKPPIACIDCGIRVPINWHGAGGQKRCGRCRKEALKAAHQLRRVRKLGNGVEQFTSLEIFERDGWKCGLCGKRIGKTLKHPHPRSASLDHIVPISRGGGHYRTNVQAAHLTCNLRKSDGGGGQLLLIG